MNLATSGPSSSSVPRATAHGRMVQRIYPDRRSISSRLSSSHRRAAHAAGARAARRPRRRSAARRGADRHAAGRASRSSPRGRTDAPSCSRSTIRAHAISSPRCAATSPQATAGQADDEDAVAAWIGRFAKWRRMLQGGPRASRLAASAASTPSCSPFASYSLPQVGFDEAVRGLEGARRRRPRLRAAADAASRSSRARRTSPRSFPSTASDSSTTPDSTRSSSSISRSRCCATRARPSPMIVATLRRSRRRAARGRNARGPAAAVRLRRTCTSRSTARTGYTLRRTSVFEVATGFPADHRG